MTLYTKCIFLPVEKSDGLRISVMSRHTGNDGVTPDNRIIPGTSYDEWLRSLAPSGSLVGAHYRGEIQWDYFERTYLESIRNSSTRPLVRNIALLSMLQNITLLCAEETPEFCHRRLLAEACKQLESRVEIVHKLP